MAFVLPNLPYAPDALEPYVDTTTMTIHHGKHHAAYVNNVNAALEKFPEMKSLGIVDLNKVSIWYEFSVQTENTLQHTGGGHFNHSFFWKVMTKPSNSNGPSAELKAAIDKAFGSMEAMKEKFNAAAAGRFGSGWAWLGVKPDGSLGVTSTANQDNPLQQVAEEKMIPILGLDVWEHAYYLKYQNRRPEYIAAFWNVVNWEQVNDNFKAACGGGMPAL
ncbi:manganese superoxide dismutase [Dunaliella salina]|uniref:Superoxide dismutase n=1 Tax=Dunaliella salina TaxID=3046 RepID=A0ABQ7GEJ8_DUNSA|nr:manganese superoxide dismutase [Dunaliella salina]|eukprot:KAF5833024.1 manganese superoxide dismutase [Dunaliella salina]